jgi:hypothetical protein
MISYMNRRLPGLLARLSMRQVGVLLVVSSLAVLVGLVLLDVITVKMVPSLTGQQTSVYRIGPWPIVLPLLLMLVSGFALRIGAELRRPKK